ncbi:MAG: phosphoribosylglycinamide formyltransferase [Limisphaerales bacterium]
MSDAPPFRLGVLGSGNGSNFVAIAEACASGVLPASVALVLSDVPGAGILARAQERGIEGRYLSPGSYRSKLDEAAEQAYVDALKAATVDLVVLAGFMRILKAGFLTCFPDRVVNIHPSLLPSFPGLRAWQQALDYGVKFTGVTVHLVDQGIDTGPIVAQAPVPVLDNDDPDSLHRRIQDVEHELYPRAIAVLMAGQAGLGRRGPGRAFPQEGKPR